MIYLAILNLILNALIIFLVLRFMPEKKLKELREKMMRPKAKIVAPPVQKRDIKKIINILNEQV